MTAAVVGLLAHYVAGVLGPAAIVIGNGLALSSTAVVLQVNILDFSSILLKICGLAFNSLPPFLLYLHLKTSYIFLFIFIFKIICKQFVEIFSTYSGTAGTWGEHFTPWACDIFCITLPGVFFCLSLFHSFPYPSILGSPVMIIAHFT